MPIEDFYQDLELYRMTDGDWSGESSYNKVRNFKGLIQTNNKNLSFTNGKDTQSVNAILFCNTDIQIQNKDKIKYNGKGYLIAGYGVQPKGITGIKNHHAEYFLVWDNENV